MTSTTARKPRTAAGQYGITADADTAAARPEFAALLADAAALADTVATLAALERVGATTRARAFLADAADAEAVARRLRNGGGQTVADRRYYRSARAADTTADTFRGLAAADAHHVAASVLEDLAEEGAAEAVAVAYLAVVSVTEAANARRRPGGLAAASVAWRGLPTDIAAAVREAVATLATLPADQVAKTATAWRSRNATRAEWRAEYSRTAADRATVAERDLAGTVAGTRAAVVAAGAVASWRRVAAEEAAGQRLAEAAEDVAARVVAALAS